jgi:hypothetical protein
MGLDDPVATVERLKISEEEKRLIRGVTASKLLRL